MTNYTYKFTIFAKERMKDQGEEIRKWAKLDNPLLKNICLEIIEASEENP